MDFIEHWLRRDEWTFKEAATLLNGVDPKHIKKINFKDDAYISNSLRKIDRIKKVVPTYLIFCSANWESYDIFARSCHKSDQRNYFRMAYDKDIEISPEILKRRAEYQAKIESNNNLLTAMTDTHPRGDSETGEQNAGEIQSTKSIQDSRELVLRGWLKGKEFKDDQSLELTQKNVWSELSEAVPDIFKPVSDETIKEFFKKQKFCGFKSGRRKGGIS